MDRKRVRLMKRLDEKTLADDREFMFYLRTLPWELWDKLKAERKMLLESEELRRRAEELGDIVYETLKRELRLKWTDFWEISRTCTIGKSCPLEDFLGMRHPSNIYPTDLMNFAHKVSEEVWIDVFRYSPERFKILKTINETAYAEAVLFQKLRYLMSDKLEDVIDWVIEDELDEIESRVEGEFAFPSGEMDGELEVDPYDVRMKYLKDVYRVIQDPTYRSRFDIWLVRNVKTLGELYPSHLLWTQRNGKEDEESIPSSEEIDLNEELLARLARLYIRDEILNHLKEVRKKFAEMKKNGAEDYDVKKFLSYLVITLKNAYAWIVDNIGEIREEWESEDYYEEEGERLQKQLLELFLKLLLKELDRELTLRKRRGRRPDQGNELIYSIIDQFKELLYGTEDGWNRIFDVRVKEKAYQTLDGELMDIYYAVPKTYGEYKELLLEFIKKVVRFGQDLLVLWNKINMEREEVRQEWVSRMRDILTAAEARALSSKQKEYYEQGERAHEHRWDYRQIDSLSLKLFDLLVELIDELVSEERIVVGRPVFEE